MRSPPHKNIAMVVTDVVMPQVGDGELARQLAGLRSNFQFLFVSRYAGKTILGHKVADLETNFRRKPLYPEAKVVENPDCP